MDDKNLDKKLPVIPKDAVVELKISGNYYHDLKRVFNDFLLEGETKENIGKILDNLTNGKITSAKEHRLYVMFLIIGNFELVAKNTNIIEYKTLDEINASSQS